MRPFALMKHLELAAPFCGFLGEHLHNIMMPDNVGFQRLGGEPSWVVFGIAESPKPHFIGRPYFSTLHCRLVCRTANGCGIAAGSPICINKGPDFVQMAREGDAEPRTKRFRGAMDAFFRADDSTSSMPTTSTPGRGNPAAPQALAVPATEPESEPKPVQGSPAKPITPEAGPATAEISPAKPATPAKDGQESAGPGLPNPPEHGAVLSELKEPFACVFRIVDSNPPTLHVKNMTSENKNLKANVVIKSWKTGTFTNAPEKQPADHSKHLYELTPKTLVYSNDLSKVQSLAQVVKDKGGPKRNAHARSNVIMLLCGYVGPNEVRSKRVNDLNTSKLEVLDFSRNVSIHSKMFFQQGGSF